MATSTGRGNWPFFSTWMGNAAPWHRQEAAADGPAKAVWSDWFFEAGGAGFPAQFFGLKIQKTGATIDLCLVAEADAPAGMGGVLKLRKGGTTYAAYLVETGDANASPVRLRTTTGTKAIRLKT